jgi:thioredoxin-like negative regulator of GroEL
MKGWISTWMILAVLAGVGCKNEEQAGPSTLAPVQIPVVQKPVTIPPGEDSLAGLRAGTQHRKTSREKTGVTDEGSIYQKDSSLVLVRCEGGKIRIAVEGGNTNHTYLDGEELVVLAKRVSERALSTPLENEFIACDLMEASYWARDAQGSADFVVRYPVEATETFSLWVVPDVGEPTRIEASEIPSRVFVGQLLRVAHYLGEYKGEIRNALILLERALRLDGANLDALALYVEWMVEFKPSTAYERILAFEEQNGVSNRTKLLRAQSLFARGQSEDAKVGDALLAEVLAVDPAHREARFHVAHRLMEKGDRKGALAAFRSLLEQEPALGMVRCTLGELLIQLGDSVAALKELDACLEFDEDDASARLQRADLLIAAGRLDEARADLTALKRLVPGDPAVGRLEKRLSTP